MNPFLGSHGGLRGIDPHILQSLTPRKQCLVLSNLRHRNILESSKAGSRMGKGPGVGGKPWSWSRAKGSRGLVGVPNVTEAHVAMRSRDWTAGAAHG